MLSKKYVFVRKTRFWAKKRDSVRKSTKICKNLFFLTESRFFTQKRVFLTKIHFLLKICKEIPHIFLENTKNPLKMTNSHKQKLPDNCRPTRSDHRQNYDLIWSDLPDHNRSDYIIEIRSVWLSNQDNWQNYTDWGFLHRSCTLGRRPTSKEERKTCTTRCTFASAAFNWRGCAQMLVLLMLCPGVPLWAHSWRLDSA